MIYKTSTKILFLFILGIIYSYLIRIEISPAIPQEFAKFSFTISSKIDQNIKLHIATKDELKSLSCEKSPNTFTYYRGGYDFKQQEEVSLILKKGINHCQLRTVRSSSLKPILKQKLSFIDYLWLFIFFIVPLFHVLFQALMWLLNKVWRKNHA